MSNKNIQELTVWKYNKSGTLPQHVLRELAENEDLSFEAIGVFITLFMCREIAPSTKRLRVSNTIGVTINELLRHNLLLTDEMIKAWSLPTENESE